MQILLSEITQFMSSCEPPKYHTDRVSHTVYTVRAKSIGGDLNSVCAQYSTHCMNGRVSKPVTRNTINDYSYANDISYLSNNLFF